MPFLGIAKQRLAAQLGSSATLGEGAQNLLCAYFAEAVFLGLSGNALFGWWWLDPIATFVIAGVAVGEGLETWRGEGCCATPAFAPPTSNYIAATDHSFPMSATCRAKQHSGSDGSFAWKAIPTG